MTQQPFKAHYLSNVNLYEVESRMYSFKVSFEFTKLTDPFNSFNSIELFEQDANIKTSIKKMGLFNFFLFKLYKYYAKY